MIEEFVIISVSLLFCFYFSSRNFSVMHLVNNFFKVEKNKVLFVPSIRKLFPAAILYSGAFYFFDFDVSDILNLSRFSRDLIRTTFKNFQKVVSVLRKTGLKFLIVS